MFVQFCASAPRSPVVSHGALGNNRQVPTGLLSISPHTFLTLEPPRSGTQWAKAIVTPISLLFQGGRQKVKEVSVSLQEQRLLCD